MKVLSFKLSGRTAFFRKPEVNSYAYFTYNNIHKVALLGLIGCVIGLGGYTQQYDRSMASSKKNGRYEYPEFYEKLRNIKLSIVPLSKHGAFSKKIQIFNNSVGYASQEEGGNLIVREQWLENPAWNIYIQLNNYKNDEIEGSLLNKVSEYFTNNKCQYMPYLGKNDHFAKIDCSRIIEMDKAQEVNHIDSLFPLEGVTLESLPYDYPDNEENPYLFKEISPYALNEEYNFYEYKEMCKTNLEISDIGGCDNNFEYDGKIIAFY